MLDLTSSFAALQPPTSGGHGSARFSAIPIPGFDQQRLGKDAAGTPSLLITVVGTKRHEWPAPIVLEHLSVQHDVDCRVTRSDGSVEEGRFTVVHCTSNDPALHAYFLRVAGTILTLLGSAPSQSDVTRAIDQLVELFRAVTMAPRKSVQGLWAELFVIAQARDPAALVSAWHTLPEDRYDFSAGSQRIEVKSASGRMRHHYFTVEQVHPPLGTEVLVASVFVERAGGGLALMDLVARVRSAVGSTPELLFHVDRVVSLTLGDSWRSAQGERFDRELAEASLAFYAPQDIPKVGADLPPAVSNVRFRSDLTGVPPIGAAECRAAGGLFRDMLRR